MIQVYRPLSEIGDVMGVIVTDVRMAEGKVQTYIVYNGEPGVVNEDPSGVLPAIRVTSGTLTNVVVKDRNAYYTLSEVGQLYTRPGFLERDWFERDNRMRTLTGVRLAGDGVDYDVVEGGQPRVLHESAESVLRELRILGVRLTGAEFKDGTSYYTVAELS